MTRKETEKQRTPPGQADFKQDCLAVIDKMGWHNTQEAKKVMDLDDWHACIDYGYWVGTGETK